MVQQTHGMADLQGWECDCNNWWTCDDGSSNGSECEDLCEGMAKFRFGAIQFERMNEYGSNDCLMPDLNISRFLSCRWHLP